MKNIIPNSVTRFGYRTILKANASSPTVLVIAGVGGLVATAVMAAKATRHLDPVMDEHYKGRMEIAEKVYVTKRARQQDLLKLYTGTGMSLGKIYGPTVFVGASSTIAVLGGHRILRGRQIATLAAYSGLADQFQGYRDRVTKTLGTEVEKGIYEGARGEWKESDTKGEYKLEPVFDGLPREDAYLRPWYDEGNTNWVPDATSNRHFLTGVQTHMNNLLRFRGHVFLNEVYDALGMQRVPEGAIAGWLHNGDGDNYVDFGFLASIDPNTIAFVNGHEKTVRLNFNIDRGAIWSKI